MIFAGRPTTEPFWRYLLARIFGRRVGQWTYWRGKLYCHSQKPYCHSERSEESP